MAINTHQIYGEIFTQTCHVSLLRQCDTGIHWYMNIQWQRRRSCSVYMIPYTFYITVLFKYWMIKEFSTRQLLLPLVNTSSLRWVRAKITVHRNKTEMSRAKHIIYNHSNSIQLWVFLFTMHVTELVTELLGILNSVSMSLLI